MPRQTDHSIFFANFALKDSKRANLAIRGVLQHWAPLCCSLCRGELETENRLFILRHFAWSIWVKVYKKFGVEGGVALPGQYLVSFLLLYVVY
jgi:hypothetical protein